MFDLWGAGDTLDFNSANRYRSLRASYWLPSMDEWHKAAYYDPGSGTYFDYATGSNTAPTAVTGVTGGTTAGTAVYLHASEIGPADISNAGGLSPYGTMGQNGNVWEWEETAFDLFNSTTGENRGLRGGFWGSSSSSLQSSSRLGSVGPASGGSVVGFRVAGASVVPAPSRTLLGVVGLCSVLLRRRRRFASF